MTASELHASMSAKGFVRGADGFYYRPSRAGVKGNSSPAQQEQVQKPQATAPELSHTELEKLQDVVDESEGETVEEAAADFQAGVSTMEGSSHPKFRITVTFYVSGGRRDPTGMFETICDLITHTRRRLLERLSGGKLESRGSPARKRRVQDRDRASHMKGLF